MQVDTELLPVQCAHVWKESLQLVIRITLGYVREVCSLAGRPVVLKRFEAAFNAFTKKTNTDNGRKQRSAMDLLFLSWAKILNYDGVLLKILKSDPWNLADKYADGFIEALTGTLKFLELGEGKRRGKFFRDDMRDAMLSFTTDENTSVVWITGLLLAKTQCIRLMHHFDD